MKRLSHFPIVLMLILAFDLGAAAQNEVAPTTITIKQYRHAPIEIVNIKYDGNEVVNGGTIQAPLDWVKSLSVTVKNVSPHMIQFLHVSLEFSNEKGEFSHAFLSMMKGRFTHLPPYNGELLLSPGEEFVLTVDQFAYDFLLRQIQDYQIPESALHQVIVNGDGAGFSPDRYWKSGWYINRDPLHSDHWVFKER